MPKHDPGDAVPPGVAPADPPPPPSEADLEAKRRLEERLRPEGPSKQGSTDGMDEEV